MDPLAEILNALRVDTTIFSHSYFSAPWSVQSGGVAGAIFHAVVDGECWVTPQGEDQTPRNLQTGDIVVLTRGQGHLMGSASDLPGAPRVQLREAGAEIDDSGFVEKLRFGGGGTATELVCGHFATSHRGASVLELLPAVMVLRPPPQLRAWIDDTLSMMRREIRSGRVGSDVIITRLADVLLIQLLRSHAETSPDAARGWLAAARDPQVGRALAVIHGQPGQPWTAESLAAEVGLSRTAFYERFTDLVGESPKRYLTRWRMQAAAELLAEFEQLSVAEVAERVAYTSEEAFIRAFKREMKVTPAGFRRRRSAA